MSDTATRTYTAEEQATNRAKWVGALRSGDFEQGAYMLRRPDGALCCLGVACAVAEAEGAVQHDRWEGRTKPPIEVVDWLGLTDKEGPTGVLDTIGDPIPLIRLIRLNDIHGFTFADIADVIEGGSLEVQA